MFGFILHLCVVSRLIIFRQFRFISTLVEDYFSRRGFFGKISAQPHTSLCIQFLNRENND